jgi:hypothetical protein
MWITHQNSCGKIYTYLNKNVMIKYKGDANNIALGFTFLTGVIGSTGGDLFLTGFSAYPAFSYGKLSNDIQTCLDNGAKSAWLDEYGGTISLNLTCSY